MSSFIRRLAGQDPVQLTRIGCALAFMVTGNSSFGYNFPLMLFGLVSFELSSTNPEQYFLTLTAVSGVFDIFIIVPETIPPVAIIMAVLVALKFAVYQSGVAHLRARGGDIAWTRRGFGLPTAASQGASGSGSSSHTPAAPVQSPAGSFPSGGQRLGGGDEESGGSKQTRDGYTTIS